MTFNIKKKDLAGVLNLAFTVEMPLTTVISELEMAGMGVDQEYGELLSKSFHKKLDKIDAQMAEELEKLAPQIAAWRLTPDANIKPKKKTGEGEGKSKNEQLTDPINLASPTQLAILLYDILKAPVVSNKSPRGTGEDELKAIASKLKLSFCDILLERREVVKLITTYVDVIPQLAKRWPDGRLRSHFQQYGADTGRLSSGGKITFGLGDECSGVNYQNIPSHNKAIRMLFCSPTQYHNVTSDTDFFDIPETDEVQVDFNDTVDSWKWVSELQIGDYIVLDNNIVSLKNIIKNNRTYRLFI